MRTMTSIQYVCIMIINELNMIECFNRSWHFPRQIHSNIQYFRILGILRCYETRTKRPEHCHLVEHAPYPNV